MSILRSVFITCFIKILALHYTLGIYELMAVGNNKENGVMAESLSQLRAAIVSGNLSAVKEMLGVISSAELNQEVSGEAILDYTLQRVDPQFDDATTVEMISSNISKVTELFFEVFSQLTLNGVQRTTFDAPYFASLLQGIKVNDTKAWESARSSNYQKIQEFLTQKAAKSERRTEVLKMLIEHGASCNFDAERSVVVQLWKSLAIELERGRISDSFIKKFLASIAHYHPEALERLNAYLTSLLNDCDKNMSQAGLRGFEIIHKELKETLRVKPLQNGKARAKSLGRVSTTELMSKLSTAERSEFLRLGGITAASLKASADFSGAAS